jgi:hypothetical protein
MISENTQKQLLLISGILTAAGGLIGAAAEIIKKTIGCRFGRLSPFTSEFFFLAYGC